VSNDLAFSFSTLFYHADDRLSLAHDTNTGDLAVIVGLDLSYALCRLWCGVARHVASLEGGFLVRK
jgi:hypothetical protein